MGAIGHGEVVVTGNKPDYTPATTPTDTKHGKDKEVTLLTPEESAAAELERQLAIEKELYQRHQLELKELFASGQDENLQSEADYNEALEQLTIQHLERMMDIAGLDAEQQMKIEDAQENGLAVPLLGDGSVVRTLMSEILLRRSTRPESAPLKLETLLLEDVKQTGRTWFSIDRPLFRKTLVYSDSLPSEGSAGLDSLLRNAVAEILRAEAKLILPGKVALFASRFGFRYSRVSVKRNSSNWGSCSVRGNINLNLNLVRLPEPLCDCVVLHELCHLKHPDHGPGFHSLLEKLCTDNVARLAMTGDPYLPELAAKINRSRAAMPVHTTMERELKKHRML